MKTSFSLWETFGLWALWFVIPAWLIVGQDLSEFGLIMLFSALAWLMVVWTMYYITKKGMK